MKTTYLHIAAIICLLGLVAFKPWKQINQSVGVRNELDSLSIATEKDESIEIVQPMQVVLPQVAIDSIVATVNKKDSILSVLKKKDKKLDRELSSLLKSNQEKQSSLITEQEIEGLITKQNKPRRRIEPNYEPPK